MSAIASFPPAVIKTLYCPESSISWGNFIYSPPATGYIITNYNKITNFASLISARLAQLFGMPLGRCRMPLAIAKRLACQVTVGTVFSFGAKPPKEHNIIVFDDFVTTSATMISMKYLLEPLGKNLVFFTGINNKI